jgi:hypothetical protein
MKNNRWLVLILVGVVIGLVAGMLIPRLLSLVNAEAYAQGAAPKRIQLVRTGIMLDPEYGKPYWERWQDPETKVICYVGSKGFSCVRY